MNLIKRKNSINKLTATSIKWRGLKAIESYSYNRQFIFIKMPRVVLSTCLFLSFLTRDINNWRFFVRLMNELKKGGVWNICFVALRSRRVKTISTTQNMSIFINNTKNPLSPLKQWENKKTVSNMQSIWNWLIINYTNCAILIK